MVRKTSIETYRKVSESGILSKKRQQVYSMLFTAGPSTACEIADLLKKSGVKFGPNANISPRLFELRAMGVVDEIGERVCSITRTMVILWGTTDNMPVKYEKPVKHKCRACGGKGYIKEQQAKMF